MASVGGGVALAMWWARRVPRLCPPYVCLWTTFVSVTAFVAQPASAQWRDAKTGKPVASGPMLAQKSYPGGGVRPGIEAGKLEGIRPNAGDPKRAYDPVSGRNFFFDERTCQWKDSATGQVVASGPMLAQKSYPGGGVRPGIEAGKLEGIRPNAGDPKRAFDPVSGRNFVFDCKPTKKAHKTTPPPKPKVKHKVAKKPPPENAVLPPVGIGIGISIGGGSGGHERSRERER